MHTYLSDLVNKSVIVGASYVVGPGEIGPEAKLSDPMNWDTSL